MHWPEWWLRMETPGTPEDSPEEPDLLSLEDFPDFPDFPDDPDLPGLEDSPDDPDLPGVRAALGRGNGFGSLSADAGPLPPTSRATGIPAALPPPAWGPSACPCPAGLLLGLGF